MNGVADYTVVDFQICNPPHEVLEEVRKLWMDYEYPNDYAYHRWSDDVDAIEFPKIAEFLSMNELGNEHILIHYWW